MASIRTSTLGRAALVALAAVLPPRCLACGETVTDPRTLCSGCWAQLLFLAPPVCAACGYPFEFDSGPGALCGACMAQRPAYGRARAVFKYDEASRGLILALKHGDRTDAAPALAGWMAGAGHELLAGAEVVAPVPLHRWRLLSRRFNQAALLAHGVAARCGVVCIPDLLIRRRNTPSQGKLTAAGRARNVAGAFAVNPARVGALRARRVVLVDDVLTTGATAEACARTLMRGGAESVDVLTLARVVRPSYI
jgi:ComF family protein